MKLIYKMLERQSKEITNREHLSHWTSPVLPLRLARHTHNIENGVLDWDKMLYLFFLCREESRGQWEWEGGRHTHTHTHTHTHVPVTLCGMKIVLAMLWSVSQSSVFALEEGKMSIHRLSL